jgi:hypothetical protein
MFSRRFKVDSRQNAALLPPLDLPPRHAKSMRIVRQCGCGSYRIELHQGWHAVDEASIVSDSK